LYVKTKIIQNIEGLLKLRRYIGFAAAGCVLSPLAFLLYRNSKSTEKITIDDAALAAMNVVKALNLRFEHYFNKPFEYFVGRGCLFLTVMWFMVLIEKIIVLLVSTQYHRRSLSIRMRKNELGRKITAGLRKHFIKSGIVQNKNAPSGELVYDAIGKEIVGLQEFSLYMDEDEAGDYIDVLDPGNLFSGHFNRERYIEAVNNLEKEHIGIRQTLRGQLRVLNKFDTLLLCIASFVLFFVLIAIMEPPVDFLVSFLVSLIAGLAFVFGPTAKETFDSIVFVLFTHSFDIGDWLILADGVMYQPVDIGLMCTSFLTQQNDLTYFTNNSLSGMAIVNLRRSPMMSEPIRVPIVPDTPEEKISQLESKINEWLETQPSLFLPKISLREFNITDDGHMIVEVRLFHRYNFDDMAKKDHRSRLFVLKLRDILKGLGIKISQPVLPSSVKPFK
jgi:small-conductance mechanosensitive channel